MSRLKSKKTYSILLLVALAQLVFLASGQEYPDARYFKNSNLTLFTNGKKSSHVYLGQSKYIYKFFAILF